MQPEIRSLLTDLPASLADESFESLLSGGRFELKRIISTGHTTPPGEWYDQDEDEWVIVLSGAAELLIHGESHPRRMNPGDSLLLPANCRHRVSWTDKNQPTVWLALHCAVE